MITYDQSRFRGLSSPEAPLHNHSLILSPQFSRSVMSTLCDLMDCSMPGFSVHQQLPELAQIRVHWVSDEIQPPHPLSSPPPLSPLPYPLPMIFICNLIILRILYQWNHILSNLLRLALSTQHDSFSSVQIVAYIDNLFILIAAWYSVVWIYYSLTIPLLKNI